ncbi:MAG: RtcB family protein [Myxococcales bacterium]|nr:RtcB family protein [Myxococcales bacterium]MCB9749809.1 RtcB family protein [Myxococcales bacterium]
MARGKRNTRARGSAPTAESSPAQTPKRVLAALAREGLDVERAGGVVRVRRVGATRRDEPSAEVLLPEDFRLEAKALKQLTRLAGARHPAGGHACRVCASPDFHPGDSGVAIGSIVETRDMVIPGAVGSDINCGMRMHVVDVDAARLLARRDEFVARMKGDFFFGTRDLPMTRAAMAAMFRGGVPAWLAAVRAAPQGRAREMDLGQLERELARVHLGGCLEGHERWAPEDLLEGALVRDGGLATIGGGNHFVELQLVEEVVDRRRAYALGVRAGQLAFMIHSGSRGVGKHVGAVWRDRARASWPQGHKYPDGELFPLSRAHDPRAVDEYLEAEATAANYGFVNRLLLAELLRLRLRELLGELAAPLVYDLPHNITLPSPGRADAWITRKGACPAELEQPVIIPGSMGASSYLLVGRGSDRLMRSASHGAGRARSRFSMGRRGASRDEDALGLTGVDCITLRAERRIEEAPAAYKPIGPVVECQVEAGVATVVARMRPLMTFKA